MLVGIESKSLQMKRFKDIYEKEPPKKETLIIISEKPNFLITDGYIQFMKLALHQAFKFYGKQDEEWQKIMNKIYHTAEKLCDKNVRFEGTTKEEFHKYCKQVSSIMDRESPSLPTLTLISETSDNMLPIMEKYLSAGHSFGFSYDETENVETELMNDLMNQLSGLKMEKSSRTYDISYYLTSMHYHEHVHDALNVLIGTAVYAINCSSTRGQKAHDFDIDRVEMDLNHIRNIIERIENLV